MKVFITGASGWVGRHVVPELLKHGHTITAIARSEASAIALEKQGVTVVRGDLENTDLLQSSAKASDAVIHLAYIHDFSDYGGKPAQIDFAAIKAMCSGLEETNKPFIGTSGLLGLPLPQDETVSAPGGPRKQGEEVAFSFNDKGVKSIVIRLSPSVHGTGDHGFVPFLIDLAKKNGYSGYIKDTKTRWTGVHVKDAAVLYRLAIENKNQNLKGGEILHATSEKGVSIIEISKLIGENLNLESKELVEKKDINDYFGWMSHILSMDCNATSEITREKTGWEPKEVGLLEDIKTNYF
ncbi:uncharacterized protein L201_005371 [Kwoniella dendrophila CBS 6074]|uniref:NAD-dependent epimerase/dehydratase domain-containing protein n=1 Tax=Kwoniella dendrophila CBS 6074 TaxID=1295534 RepID=A0AAX4JYE8_9TREE